MTKIEASAPSATTMPAYVAPPDTLVRPPVRIIDTSRPHGKQNVCLSHTLGATLSSRSMSPGLYADMKNDDSSFSQLAAGAGYGGAFALHAPAARAGAFRSPAYTPVDGCDGGFGGSALDDAEDWADDTIIQIPYEGRQLATPTLDELTSAESQDRAINRRMFRIRPADDHGRRAAASMLINKMYARRGYDTGFLSANEQPNRITLVASDDDETLGTLSLGLDSEAGLLVDEMYRDEVDAVRAQGRSVCEVTKLAIDQQQGSKRVLASLFHIAYIYARILNQVTDVFIEVNPRHAPFYRRMLKFKQCGEVRVCPRVNAPAVLLRLELDFMDEQIRALGGRADLGNAERSLYPYFFSKREEAGIARRLRTLG